MLSVSIPLENINAESMCICKECFLMTCLFVDSLGPSGYCWGSVGSQSQHCYRLWCTDSSRMGYQSRTITALYKLCLPSGPTKGSASHLIFSLKWQLVWGILRLVARCRHFRTLCDVIGVSAPLSAKVSYAKLSWVPRQQKLAGPNSMAKRLSFTRISQNESCASFFRP